MAPVLALLFVAPAASGAWDQIQGDASRSPFVGLSGAPLDVLVNTTLPDGMTTSALWGAGAVDSPHGIIVGAMDPDGACVLLVYPEPSSGMPTARHPVEDCSNMYLIGYDPVLDVAVICSSSDGQSPVVHAVRPTDGALRWTLLPAALDPPADDTFAWQCYSGALDVAARELFLPLTATIVGGVVTAGRVAAVSLDTGEPRWVARFPSQDALDPSELGFPTPERGERIYVDGITLTQSGLVVTAYLPCSAVGPILGACQEGMLAWYDRNGNLGGSERAWLGKTNGNGATGAGGDPTARAVAVSKYAVARGAIAASVSGPDLILVNPESTQPVLRTTLRGFESAATNVFWPSGAWSEDALVVGFPHSLSAYEPASLEPRWSWTLGLDWGIVEMFSTESGVLHVLLSDDNAIAQRYVEIRARDGKFLRSLPLYLDTQDENGGWDAHLAVHAQKEVVIVSELGGFAVLGPATDQLPALAVNDEYPAVGAAVEVAVPEDAAEYRINWGDGSEEAAAPGAIATHSYAESGGREVRLTAMLPGGLTRTSALALHVGETPPPTLSAIQTAFSPEYQNWTFFVLGLLVTVVGVVVTVGRQRRRFNKLERELAAVEEIRMLSVSDPRGAVQALKAYRARLPQDLARGRIDDSQYHVLDLRSARLLKVLRTRMFAPHDVSLSVRYHRLLEAAFEDAVLQPSERDALVAALDAEEGVLPGERVAIAGLLADFTSEAVHNNA